MRVRPLALLLLAAVAAGGCGDGDATRLAEEARRRAEALRGDARRLRDRAERLRDRLRQRVRDTLERLERAIPAAGPATRAPRRGDASLEAFLTEVLRSVDAYAPGDVEEALGTAKAVGDFEYLSPGTTAPRMSAARPGCAATAAATPRAAVRTSRAESELVR